jgi:hypothetical protein
VFSFGVVGVDVLLVLKSCCVAVYFVSWMFLGALFVELLLKTEKFK